MVEPARYAELHAHCAFTFLDGANTPSEMVDAACALNLEALAVLDVDGMYSAIQMATAGRARGLPIVCGAELTLDPQQFSAQPGWGLVPGAEEPGIRLPIIATNPCGYTQLCAAMSRHTLSHLGRRTPMHMLDELGAGEWIVLTGTSRGPLRRALRAGGMPAARSMLTRLISIFGRDRVAVESALSPTEPPETLRALSELATGAHVPLVATTAARCATPVSGPLGDVLAATRLGMSLEEAEPHLPAFRSFLRSAEEMLLMYHDYPDAVRMAADIGSHASFDLRLVAPRLPETKVPEGFTSATWLRHLTEQGALERYGTRADNPHAWEVIDHELSIIERMDFPGYFLIVKEIVDFCASRNILCQGRGSAANSAVCFALGITAVDAVRHSMLFERFLSPGRSGPPDIDVDIEAGRREEVIQHVYEHYGRERAAQVATVITYRHRSAIHDAARACGYAAGIATKWSKSEGDPPPDQVTRIAQKMSDLPRHMGIHTGGMVLTRTPVSHICPVQWGAMEDRSVLQWDKDDCADAGLVKFDLLGLGMLTAIRRAFDWLGERGITGRNGRALGLHNLTEEDPRVYDLLCAADTVGVFQVESRAQMNTLPRLRPRCFYDIVVEVALIRPGPIQGQAVNPYLRRRQGAEAVTYLHPLLKPALEKTLGVPLFQEQLMRIAQDAAGFTAAQADRLRKAMGSKRSLKQMDMLKPPLMEGMRQRGISEQCAHRIFDQLRGFASFGFPESHSFSFAHIVYASAWLKVHYPEFFYAGILSSQPMGFYSPDSLIHDARRHGVAVARADVQFSDVSACVQPYDPAVERCANERVELDMDDDAMIRIGLESIRGLGEGAHRIVDARADGPFSSMSDVAQRAHLTERQVEACARAGAFDSLAISRRDALWGAERVAEEHAYQPYIPGIEVGTTPGNLPQMSDVDQMRADYQATGLTVAEHPLALIRSFLDDRGVVKARDLMEKGDDGSIASVAGIVTHRQRPHTARGLIFVSLEDESGFANIVCSPGLWTRYRTTATTAQALIVSGTVERGEGVVMIRAHSLKELHMPMRVRSRDFR